MFLFLFCSPLLSSFVLYHVSLAFIFLSLKKDFRAEKSKQVTIYIPQVTQVDMPTHILHSYWIDPAGGTTGHPASNRNCLVRGEGLGGSSQ
jgi:hypothetical protein